MAEHDDGRWVNCMEKGCIGVRLPSGERCWAHAEANDLNAALEKLSDRGQLDGRGVVFTTPLLQRILDASPHHDDGRSVVTGANFTNAVFKGDAVFENTTFRGEAVFNGAIFERDAAFESATFTNYAGFYGARFRHGRFNRATFEGDADFTRATFDEVSGFIAATFNGGVGFNKATFGGDVAFTNTKFLGGDAIFFMTTFTSGATFHSAKFAYGVDFSSAVFGERGDFNNTEFVGSARFFSTVFKSALWLQRATFERDALFGGTTFQRDGPSGATFKRDALFNGALFEGTRQLGPLLVRKCLVLDDAVFRERAEVKVSAAVVCCRRVRFLAGVQVVVRWAQVILDDTDLAAPSIIAGVTDPFEDLDEGRWARALERLWGSDTRGQRPKLVSLCRADVAGLTVSAVDMRGCRFVGSHHLDKLRVEESDFGSPPTGWRWTTRQTIAEEHHWRADQEAAGDTTLSTGASVAGESTRFRGWYQRAHRPPAWLEVERPSAAQVASLYRDLRKGREDNKDEPGAADLYYGEMEMRRHAKRQQICRELGRDNYGTASNAAAEYAILWVYWIVSGYALRAWRALVTLAVVVILSGCIFAFWGFEAPREPAFRPVGVDAQGELVYERQNLDRRAGLDELPTALRFSAQSSSALLRGPDVRELTAIGEWLQIALRLVGPVLLGLAILSVRGRVKR